MKLCKDCAHFVMHESGIQWYASHRCAAANFPASREPVTGSVIPGQFLHCVDRRRRGKKCGPDALQFEAKQ